MLAADQLRLDTNPFVAGASGARMGRPLQAALGEVIQQIGLEAPVVVVSGGAGTGKTLLMSMTARAGTDLGLWVRQIDRGDLIPDAFGRCADVLLIDEADSMADSTLQTLVSAGRKTAATTMVFLCLPSNVRRFTFAGRRTVLVELTPLSESDARLFLLEWAASAGRPDLFAPEALDLLIDGSRGSPRMLRSIAGLAFFNAAFHRAPQIGPRHVADALASQIPCGAPKRDNAAVPTPAGAEIAVAAPIEAPAPAPASPASDPPAPKAVDVEAAPASDPPPSEPLSAIAGKQFGALPRSVVRRRPVSATALAASLAIAAVVSLPLMNGIRGGANASTSRPAARLVIPRQLGFAPVIPVSPAVSSQRAADRAETEKETASIAKALESAAGAEPVVATVPEAAASDAMPSADEAEAAKDAAYMMNAIAAKEAAAQAASLQEAVAPSPQEAPAPAQAATQVVDQAPARSEMAAAEEEAADRDKAAKIAAAQAREAGLANSPPTAPSP